MSCTISGRVALDTGPGTLTGLTNKTVLLRPSRTDFQYSLDSGTTWQNWQGDPAQTRYPGSIATTTTGTGAWSFKVPWTDNANEIALPADSTLPPLTWQIIDPNPVQGAMFYTGATPELIVGAAKTIKDLTTLASPDTWSVSGTGAGFGTLPAGPRRYVTLAFTAVTGPQAGLTMYDIGTANWKYDAGISSDDPTKSYTLILDTTSKTPTAGTFYLSDIPPIGKTVYADIEVYL